MPFGAPPRETRLDDLFVAQAAATPAAPAIYFRGAMLTYEQLFSRVERFSAELAALGVGPGVLVALCLDRTPDLVALVLATLRTGGAYLPLDRRLPAERLGFMLSDSGAAVLVTDQASAAWARFRGALLELADGRLVSRACAEPPMAASPPELAYVIYTSGSTGRPKGVMLGHGATHLVAWASKAYSAQARSRVAATTSLSFDPSVFEIFAALCTGGAIVLKASPLEPFAASEQPTMLGVAPSVLRELCRADAIPDSLEVLNVGGEALSLELVQEVWRRRPGLTIDNHYGPTEATTCAAVARLSRDLAGDPPLGVAVRGAEIVLRSAGGAPTPTGEVGEIHIGGPGLALGYLNRPDLTAERFTGSGDERLYRTGDLGVWRDGALYFTGRTDRQLKLRGVRIEPAEIEAILMRDPDVDGALVVTRDGPAGPQLVAYVESRQALAPAAVRARLRTSLPEYMTPAHVIVLRGFPRLVSGKVDHAALPDPRQPAACATGIEAALRRERPILHVFTEVLGRPAIGPDDSFFDLGGDSLASVRAAVRLEELLGHEVPAGLLHQAPTARALAAALEHARLSAASHLSLLQPGAPASTPLFCLADLFGQPFNYLALARELSADHAVYGVSPGPLQAAFVADGDVQRLTASFKAELQRIRPQGPYLIAGYSAGGLLAVDLAVALERDGHAVRLVLLDALLHARRPTGAALARWTLRQGRGLLRPQTPGDRLARMRALLAALRPRRSPNWIPRGQMAFAARMIRVGAAYRPAPFAGPTLMILAQDRDPLDQLFDDDGLSGWSGVLTGEVSRATVTGRHHTFMRAPNVAATAQAVRRFLDESRGC